LNPAEVTFKTRKELQNRANPMICTVSWFLINHFN